MPIENERKFVILEIPAVEEVISSNCEKVIKISQKYLLADKGFSVRIRRSASQDDCDYVRSLTVKRDVEGQTIEIETPISQEDFESLWSVASGKVVKNRYIYQGWEIDFFKDRKYNYFAVAEIELPADQSAPSSIPDLLKPYIIYTVSYGDGRFSNKRLGDISYAEKLLREIKEMAGRDSRHNIAEAYLSGCESFESDKIRV